MFRYIAHISQMVTTFPQILVPTAGWPDTEGRGLNGSVVYRAVPRWKFRIGELFWELFLGVFRSCHRNVGKLIWAVQFTDDSAEKVQLTPGTK